jgi:hypothetical protein
VFDLQKTALLAGAGAAAVLLFVLYRKRELFNPADQRNVANVAAGAVVRELTGGADAGGEDSLGGVAARVREWLSGTDAKIEAMKRGTSERPRDAAAGHSEVFQGIP